MVVSACTGASDNTVAPVGATGSTTGVTGSTAAPTPDSSADPVTIPTEIDPGTTTSPVDPSGPSTSDSTVSTNPADTTTSTTPPPPPVLPAAKVSAAPAFGTVDLSPTAPVSVSVSDGTLVSLTMTNGEGTVVKGSLSADKKSWDLGEDLGYGKTYTVTGKAKGANGKTVAVTGSYQTVSPAEEITTSISPGDGATVGIAQPVIVRFGFTPEDPDAILKSMKITTTPKVEGAWAWITHDGDDSPSLDWRPKNYWPAGTKVHVESNIYGVKFNDSYYGGDNVTSDFTIGRSQVVYADARTYQIIVKQGCTKMNDPASCTKTVATFPASYGMGDDPDSRYGLKPQFVTRSGIHVVLDKQTEVKMQLPGYYEPTMEYFAVRISDNGEFIHQNAATVDQQGVRNVSHGCINLSPESAEAYYNSAIIGDPVEVIGTSVKLSAADGDLYEWAIPWKTWLSMSTLSS
ncbi:L,D-transpeptidase [Nakamurella silvestris]|nr:L,D-transpeptidase [Nakamurella silvestris]